MFLYELNLKSIPFKLINEIVKIALEKGVFFLSSNSKPVKFNELSSINLLLGLNSMIEALM